MSNNSRLLLLDIDRGKQRTEIWLSTLRFSLRTINLLLAVVGCAMIGFAVYTYLEVRHKSYQGFPWFIFAFGAAGILVLLTASTALVGVAHNSAFCLGLYSFLMVALLVAQAALAIAFFTDNTWRKKLPHDRTAETVAKYLEKRLAVVRWIGLASLIIQVISIALAYALSSLQQKLLEHASDEEDENLWGRRASLPSHMERGEGGPSGSSRPQRQDAWSQRMRSKYGLNIDAFSYDPSSTNQQAPSLPPPSLGRQKSRCRIM